MKNNIKIIALLLVVFLILYILQVTIGDRFGSPDDHTEFTDEPTIIFQEDHMNNMLTVTEIFPEEINCYWSEIEIINGSATFDQYGVITIGDTISNCTGLLTLKWKPSDIILWTADFRQIP